MKRGWLLLLGLVPFFFLQQGQATQPETWTLVIGGNTQGYLTPCGCTKPMVGGVRRRVTKTKEACAEHPSLVIETGRLAQGNPALGLTRQAEMKVETLAETLRFAMVDVIALHPQDRFLGDAGLNGVSRLSRATLLDTSPVIPTEESVREFEKGPFGVLSHDPARGSTGMTALSDAIQAKDDTRWTIVTAGNRDEGEKLAERFPDVILVVYTSESQIALSPLRVGKVWVVSPGMKGQGMLRLQWNGEVLDGYEAIRLDDETPNDPDAARVYRRYQDRVRAERLLEQLPRTSEEAYAGSKACRSCHEDEYKIWKKSQHADALATLERDFHDSDPECVGCHVVGLESNQGFIAREKTPHLTDVGCESCHGPAANHVKAPEKVRMPKKGADSCYGCHNSEHSPTFDFGTYWEKIKH